MPELLVVASPTSSPLSTDIPIPTDGLSTAVSGRGSDGIKPAWVARWDELHVDDVDSDVAHALVRAGSGSVTRMMAAKAVTVGAIVDLVEVVGPSHHADECATYLHETPLGGPAHYCQPDARPGHWHTPTGTVTVLDVSIPCKRPIAPHTGADYATKPVSVWTADDATAAQIREVTA